MAEPSELQPVTEPVRAGLSARSAALAAACVLVAVIWLGAAGRTAPPDSAVGPPTSRPTGQPAAAVASPPARDGTADGSGTSARPTAEPTPDPTRSPAWSDRSASLPFGDDAFAVTLVTDGRFYLGLLHEYEPGVLRSTSRLSFPAQATRARLELVQLWTRSDGQNYAPVGRHQLVINELVRGKRESRQILRAEVDARRRPAAAPRLVRQGYTITVETHTRGDHALLVVEVLPGGADARAGVVLPLVRLVAPPDKPRVDRTIGHSWLAGY